MSDIAKITIGLSILSMVISIVNVYITRRNFMRLKKLRDKMREDNEKRILEMYKS